MLWEDAPLTRLGLGDSALLGLCLVAWATCAALSLGRAVNGGPVWVPVAIAAAEGDEAHPVALQYWDAAVAGGPGLERGAALRSVNGTDLAGAGELITTLQLLAGADESRRVEIVSETAGEIREATVELDPYPLPWHWLALSAAFVIVALLGFRRAHGSPAARAGLAAATLYALDYLPFWGGSVEQTALAVLAVGVSKGLWGPLALYALLRFPGTPPAPRLLVVAAWMFLLNGLAATSLGFGAPFSAQAGLQLSAWLEPLLAVALAAAIARAYHAAAGATRRALRFVLYAGFALMAPYLLTGLVELLLQSLPFDVVAPGLWWLAWLEDVVAAVTLVFPVCLAFALVREEGGGIDRLISATLSYGALGLLLFIGLVAVVPGLARAASAGIGVDVVSTQLVVAVALASALVPLDRRLRPAIERWFFPERAAFESGVQALLQEVSRAADEAEVARLAGERLAALLRPQPLAVYENRADHFARRTRRTGEHEVAADSKAARLPPAFATGSPLVVALGAIRTPLDVAGGTAMLSPETSNELRAMGAAVVLPVHGESGLRFFLWLGPKASGDIYTATDLALLGTLAEHLKAELGRADSAERAHALQAQKEVAEAERELAEGENLAKSRFLASASHDLRQPLHALGLFVETLGHKVSEPEHVELVGRIQQSTRSLEEMMNGLLDISKLDAGGVVPEIGDFAVGPMLVRVAEDLAPLASEKGLRLRAVQTDAIARSDVQLLARILQNLVTNALRYTDRGGVVVGCRRRGDALSLEVWDSGRGIPADRQRDVFGEFKQLERDAAEGGPGLGLGLSIVDRLVRLLGHTIALESWPDRGTVFRVTLPRGQAVAAAPPARQAGPSLVGRRILVVDDDASITVAMAQLLEQWGCEALVAGSVEQAGSVARSVSEEMEAEIDAIVSDYQLADGETGAVAIAAIRAACGRDVAAVLVTGETGREELTAIKALGYPVLTKPVAPAKLRATLHQLLRF